jgi:hypothetical protein
MHDRRQFFADNILVVGVLARLGRALREPVKIGLNLIVFAWSQPGFNRSRLRRLVG